MTSGFEKKISGRAALQPCEALYFSALSESIDAGRKTARNKISLGTFPFPLRKIGKKNVVLVADFLSALGLSPEKTTDGTEGKQEDGVRRRGRPRKLPEGGA